MRTYNKYGVGDKVAWSNREWVVTDMQYDDAEDTIAYTLASVIDPEDTVIAHGENITRLIKKKTYKSTYAATSKYNRANCRAFHLLYNKKTDAEVIEKLESVPNKQNYIRELILADIAKNK